MGLTPDDVRAEVAVALRLHPRVEQQGLFAQQIGRERLIAGLSDLVPLRGEYASAIGLLDWDHRLPSRALTLRVLLHGTETAAERARGALEQRLREVAARDSYPEFDVPDLDGLPADEAYEAPVDLAAGSLGAVRLVSVWRRSVGTEAAAKGLATVRGSEALRRLRADWPVRSPQLGDIEVVGWCPPCESGHPRWTVDVWFLTTFDGRIASGRSFLVDLVQGEVVGEREFSVRVGL